MSSESAANPYSLGTDVERSEFAWTDGDVEFTEKEIRVRGDFELPRICIHSGATEDLIQRESRLTALSSMAIRAQWVTSMSVLAICLVQILESLLTDLVPGLNSRVFRDSWIFPIVLFANTGISLILHRWSHKVTIKWYLSRSYAMPREKSRQIFGVTIVLVAIFSLLMIYETASLWWLGLAVATALAGIILGRERTIGAREFRDGRFILKGHSAEFAHAWAAKTAARHDEQRG